MIPPVLEESQALARFATLAAREARPRLMALLAAAAERGLPHVLDATVLTLGAGSGGRDFALQQLPAPDAVPWRELHDIPTAIVTGSNGKTTTVRLVAACARAHGWPSAFCCTDGVFFEGTAAVSGDYSGPEGARRVMRERRAHAAIVETARGGILRRGLAISQARVAVVTNVSADHFGEYGIDDLAGLADVKLAVAGVVTPAGLLVLNAEDAQLAAKAPLLAQRFGRCPPLGWFALDADHAALRAHRAARRCHLRGARGQAAAASLGARSRPGVSGRDAAHGRGQRQLQHRQSRRRGAGAAAPSGYRPPSMAGVFARFGAHAGDNFGRLMRFERDGVRILVDYAHNPEGMRVCCAWRITCAARAGASARFSVRQAIARTARSRPWRAASRSFARTSSSSRKMRPICAAARPGKFRD